MSNLAGWTVYIVFGINIQMHLNGKYVPCTSFLEFKTVQHLSPFASAVTVTMSQYGLYGSRYGFERHCFRYCFLLHVTCSYPLGHTVSCGCSSATAPTPSSLSTSNPSDTSLAAGSPSPSSSLSKTSRSAAATRVDRVLVGTADRGGIFLCITQMTERK